MIKPSDVQVLHGTVVDADYNRYQRSWFCCGAGKYSQWFNFWFQRSLLFLSASLCRRHMDDVLCIS